MNKRLLIILIFVGLLVYSLISANVGGIYINVENNSRYNFDKIDINFLGQRVAYGKLASGKKSSYKKIKKAYDYAYINVKVANKRYVIQPIDYVGETRLPSGKYTYKLEFDPKEGRQGALSLTTIPKGIGFIGQIGVRLTEIINKNFLGRDDW